MSTNYRAGITVQEVRDFIGLTDKQATDAIISGVMTYSIVQLNHDIGVRNSDWRVRTISTEKENKVDGSNTIFYTEHWPLGDYNDDGIIDSSDVEAYTIDSNGTRASVTVSAITDAGIGKITVSSAPASGTAFYLSYSSVPLDLSPINTLVKFAIIRLTAALVYTRIDASKVGSFRVGRVSVTKQSPAYTKYMFDYTSTIRQIRSKIFKEAKFDKVI